MSDFYGATYSPDDNKIRLFPKCRLDQETFERVKAAGFKWAPRQEIFVAPMWTPGRADLAAELAGALEDEDTSLVQRAEERADRFENYSEKRTREANAARRQVEAISEQFYMGQPILVGHHSEKQARKAQERMQSGMSRAVKLWETADYWQQRAAGAIAHAKYKELPAVRHRRVKGLETDKRRHERDRAASVKFMALWERPDMNRDLALAIANREQRSGGIWSELRDDKVSFPEAAARMIAAHKRYIAHADRWLEHIGNRIAYENAMLGEAGGPAADRFPIEVGGRVLVERGEWLVVLRVNKAHGKINSITTSAPRAVHWTGKWKYGIEKVQDYRPPAAEDAAKVKKATALNPLCNYPVEGGVEMTKAEWAKKHRDYKATRQVAETEAHGAHRVRKCMTAGYSLAQVFITDQKRVDPPARELELEAVAGFAVQVEPPAPRAAPAPAKATEQCSFDLMREQLKQGIEVVVADQLFETPPHLVERMIDEAGLAPGQRILEPSAGAGAIVREILAADAGPVTAVEINHKLAGHLARLENVDEIHADFLELEPAELGTFDRILMNPPFKNGADIKHIEHARRFLKPGGRLVAICAGGPRQRAKLEPLAAESGGIWEDLPAGTFASAGTNVNTVMLTIEGPPAMSVAA